MKTSPILMAFTVLNDTNWDFMSSRKFEFVQCFSHDNSGVSLGGRGNLTVLRLHSSMGLVCVTVGLVSSLSRHHIARYYSFHGSHTVFFGQQWPCPAHTAGARLGVLSRCATLWSGILQRIGFSFSAMCLQWQECMDMYYMLWAIVQYCFCAKLFPWWQWKLFHWFLCPRQGKRTFPQVLWQMPSLSGNDFHVFFMWIFSPFFSLRMPFSPLTPKILLVSKSGRNPSSREHLFRSCCGCL